ncbi:cobalamin biosynthesis protein [Novipirellula rosea]|uniref:Cobalamin biosynthesis protein CobD n=1 Tax=Novipirellula rosea TaxID=1031540 RepID=A0ABP8NUG0_9BACT
MSEVTAVCVLLIAVVLDGVLGDPPNSLHPVAWMGRFVGWGRKRSRATKNSIRFLQGCAVFACGAVIVATVGVLIQIACRQFPHWFALLVQAAVLKSTFSVRSLAGAAGSVAEALSNEDLNTARHQVAYHLVSRDVTTLDASQLSAATIESVAENTSDSFIAPLFYFVVAGLPGALLYRFVNTADAMLGYRTHELEWFGKPAAKIDDLLNLIPSRLTALVMLMIYGAYVRRTNPAIAIWWRDHSLTASPNAGHPMSAAAGVLGIVLEKQDHYRLGEGQPLPGIQSLQQSIAMLWTTAIAAVVLSVAGLLMWRTL